MPITSPRKEEQENCLQLDLITLFHGLFNPINYVVLGERDNFND
jgi:hypothetical protein